MLHTVLPGNAFSELSPGIPQHIHDGEEMQAHMSPLEPRVYSELVSGFQLSHGQGDSGVWMGPAGAAAHPGCPQAVVGGGQPQDTREGTGLGGLPTPCGGLGGEPDQDDHTEAVASELSWGCSSPEVSCAGTWLSVCFGLPVEQLVLSTPLKPCRASLSLSLLKEGSHLQANAAFPLPLVQDMRAKLMNQGDCSLSSCALCVEGVFSPLIYLLLQGDRHTIIWKKKKNTKAGSFFLRYSKGRSVEPCHWECVLIASSTSVYTVLQNFGRNQEHIPGCWLLWIPWDVKVKLTRWTLVTYSRQAQWLYLFRLGSQNADWLCG